VHIRVRKEHKDVDSRIHNSFQLLQSISKEAEGEGGEGIGEPEREIEAVMTRGAAGTFMRFTTLGKYLHIHVHTLLSLTFSTCDEATISKLFKLPGFYFKKSPSFAGLVCQRDMIIRGACTRTVVYYCIKTFLYYIIVQPYYLGLHSRRQSSDFDAEVKGLSHQLIMPASHCHFILMSQTIHSQTHKLTNSHKLTDMLFFIPPPWSLLMSCPPHPSLPSLLPSSLSHTATTMAEIKDLYSLHETGAPVILLGKSCADKKWGATSENNFSVFRAKSTLYVKSCHHTLTRKDTARGTCWVTSLHINQHLHIYLNHSLFRINTTRWIHTLNHVTKSRSHFTRWPKSTHSPESNVNPNQYYKLSTHFESRHKVNESFHTYVWSRSRICMSHGTHTNERELEREGERERERKREWMKARARARARVGGRVRAKTKATTRERWESSTKYSLSFGWEPCWVIHHTLNHKLCHAWISNHINAYHIWASNNTYSYWTGCLSISMFLTPLAEVNP